MSCVESNPLLLVGAVQNTDGLPVLSQGWSQLSGPVPAIFVTPAAVSTYVILPSPGTYVFRFCVTYAYPGLSNADGTPATISACDDTTVVSVGCPGPKILYAAPLPYPPVAIDLSAMFVTGILGATNSEGRWRLRDSTNNYQADVTIGYDGTLDSGTVSSYWNPTTHALTPNNAAADTLLLEIGCVTESGAVEYASTGTPVFTGGPGVGGTPDPVVAAPPTITLARTEGTASQQPVQAVQSMEADTQVMCYIDGGISAGDQAMFTNAYAALRTQLKARVWNGDETTTAAHFQVFTLTGWDRSLCFRYLSDPSPQIGGTGPFAKQLSIFGQRDTPYSVYVYSLAYGGYTTHAFDGRIRRMHSVTTDTQIQQIYSGYGGTASYGFYPPNKSSAPNALFTMSLLPGSFTQQDVTRGVLAAVGLDGFA